MEIILNAVVYFLAAAAAIWSLGKLELGLTISSSGSAVVAAIAVTLMTALVMWLVTLLGMPIGDGFSGLIALVIAAVVLLVSDRLTSGMKVHGILGAVIGALAIGVTGLLLKMTVVLLARI